MACTRSEPSPRNSASGAGGRAGRAGRLGLVLLLALLLGGCLGTRFVYNQLDWVITWRLSSYFDLEKDQEQRLRETVGQSLEWVRAEQLPQYAELLRTVAREAEAGELSADRWAAIYGQVIVLFDEFLHYVVPGAVEFLAGLSDEQVEYLIEELQDENEELAKEYSGSTAEQRQQRREKAIVKSVQRFTGRLNRAQKGMVSTAVGGMHDNAERWLESRRAWQAAFRALLLERPARPEYEARLLAISLDPNFLDAPEYRAQVEANQRIVLGLLAELAADLEPRQLERLQRRLNDFASDFDALATGAG